MPAAAHPLPTLRTSATLDCGIPLDSQYFDDAGFDALPRLGSEVVLARFELPLSYCGALECFSQYTDLFARDPSEVETPGLLWQVRVNRQPLYPYHELTAILNPWGYGSFPVAIRLPEGARVELTARRIRDQVNPSNQPIVRIGGRLVGRYFYNRAYGDAR